MEKIKRWKKKILDCRRSHGSHCRSRVGYWLVVIATCCVVVGCTTLKKAGVTSLATGAAVTVATALSTGATVPILAATTTAFVASAVTDMTIGQSGTSKEKGMTDCAPDNFWSLLGQLVETGGWLLLLIIGIPMIFSWLLPGPVKFKGRDK